MSCDNFLRYIPYNYFTENKSTNIWAYLRSIQDVMCDRAYQKVIDNLYIHTMEQDGALKDWRELLVLPELATVQEERDRLRNYFGANDETEAGLKRIVTSSLSIQYSEVGVFLNKTLFPNDQNKSCEYWFLIVKDPDDVTADLDQLKDTISESDSAHEEFMGFVIGLGPWHWETAGETIGDNAYYIGHYAMTHGAGLRETLKVATGEESNQSKFDLLWKTQGVGYTLGTSAQDTPNMTVKVWGGHADILGQVFDISDQNSPTFTAPASGTEKHMLYGYINSGGNFTLAIATSGFTAGTSSTYTDVLSPEGGLIYPIALITLSSTDTSITDTMIKNIKPIR